MRRLFIEGELSENIIIRGADAHHLMHVMRAKAGQEITIVDGSSHIGRAELVEFTADTVTARLVERLEADTESPIAIELAQCLLKGDKPEFIVQKAVELGIVRIWPLVSANCVVRY
ncbi:MAG: RsmE family RNA methyltransferase, partial [Selenomonadaceae bacterium]|nr:RsmE family RNA methyltransferase [Selenomonadaceae bacterium]